MKKRVKATIFVVLLLCIVAFVLVYTRPLTLAQRYPVLDLSQCTQIQGSYSDTADMGEIQFTIHPEDPHFHEMIELFQSAAFQTRLRNIFPQGTKTHRYNDGDFKWFVAFRFEDVAFPNGGTGSGALLQINNFFGDIELSFDGKQVNCAAKNQEQLLSDVMNTITQYPDKRLSAFHIRQKV